MKPYYEQDGITIYHGDAREVIPALPIADAIITDPVWPNAINTLFGADDPPRMLSDVLDLVPRATPRVVVHLGCDSDPRILTAVPNHWPFLRACWLEYAMPHHKGRVLYTGDVAYAFGAPPKSEKGKHVLPGRVTSHEIDAKTGHPCQRKLQHVRWLISWFARGLVGDPFMGSGTTLVAAKAFGFPAWGIEIEERYCEIAAKRLQQSVLPLEDAA